VLESRQRRSRPFHINYGRLYQVPPDIVSHAKGDKQDHVLASMPAGQRLDDFVQQQERHYIQAILHHCDDSREKAANMLGISMATLYRKIEPKKK
jgi:DNA-binding NtrC family response regulator